MKPLQLFKRPEKPAKPKKTKAYVWRLVIVSGKKTRRLVLFGGISELDELIAFNLQLQKGDIVYVQGNDRMVGFDRMIGDEADASEAEGNKITIGRSGTYEFHFGIKTVGEETIRIAAPNEKSANYAIVQKKNLQKKRAHKAKETTLTVLHNLLIALLVFIWLIPIFWLVLVSFTGNLKGPSMSSFFPEIWSFENYANLFTKLDDINQFPKWLLNTLIVSVCSTIVSTIFVLATAFAFSRFRFKKRKSLMNLSMIVALFPGMLTMLVSYMLFQYVFKIDSAHVRLIIAYSAGAGLGYLVAKGFFDTIPMDIDEACKIDGASTSHTFVKVLIPLSKPIIVYTIITSFMAPWVDFVFAKIILGPQALAGDFTVAMGLFNMLSKGNISSYFGIFAAGSVVVSIPLSLLFISVQKYYVGGVTGGAVKG